MKNDIVKILKRVKHSDIFAGDIPFSKDEYAEMIQNEVFMPFINKTFDDFEKILNKL